MGARGPGARPKAKRSGGSATAPPETPAWLDESLTRAERVIAFVEGLQITQGVGEGGPFVLREWQREIIHKIYGSRQVREALVTVARKNGKTELAAALSLAHLCGPEAEPRGECYSAAADKDQAARIFRSMEAFIFANPDLDQRINIKRFEKPLR
jgi:phage terminase large subunit-like protein